ncbi:hypothetical protein [Sinorhizobium arboris]|uniref:hypothetical protein n=1 Tax=Sinorhizobium arboris TaxID=76745 RepID=UPI001F2F397B|nr:hypothetical protein [Sinorhizobium arboris]
MDDKEKFALLYDRALSLEEAIKDLDYEIERTVHTVAAGTTDTGQAMSFLRERQNRQSGFMYDLGKLEAQIADLENRIREQDERDAERQAVQAWQTDVPSAREDHLDWLRPILDAPDTPQEQDQGDRHHHYEGEERMLTEMHREDRDRKTILIGGSVRATKLCSEPDIFRSVRNVACLRLHHRSP